MTTPATRAAGAAVWPGASNDPLNGGKGMLIEGSIRTPFVVSWPGTIPSGQIYQHPVSSLDVAATANTSPATPPIRPSTA